MHRTIVHIDAVRVRTKGVPAAQARGLADGLGEAIAEALAARGITGSSRAADVNLGRIAVEGRRMDAIRAQIASRVADAVTTKG